MSGGGTPLVPVRRLLKELANEVEPAANARLGCSTSSTAYSQRNAMAFLDARARLQHRRQVEYGPRRANRKRNESFHPDSLASAASDLPPQVESAAPPRQ
jgi:hypothetical protein